MEGTEQSVCGSLMFLSDLVFSLFLRMTTPFWVSINVVCWADGETHLLWIIGVISEVMLVIGTSGIMQNVQNLCPSIWIFPGQSSGP